MYADTHCHLDFDVFDTRRPSIMENLRQNEFGFVVIPAVALSNFKKIEKICVHYERLYMGLGLHPYFIGQHTKDDLIELESSIDRLLVSECGKLVAVGEIGMDATCPDLDKQQGLFESQ